MTHVLISPLSLEGLWVDQWRIPRARVQPLHDVVAFLAKMRERGAEMEREHDAALKKAEAAGFARGIKQGRAAAGQAAAVEVEKWLRARRDQDLELRRATGELALQVARRFVGTVDARDVIAGLAEFAVQEYLDARPVSVRAAPEHVEWLARRSEAWSVHVRVIADSTLGEGECLVETAEGRVRASLSVQWSALERALATVYPSDPAP